MNQIENILVVSGDPDPSQSETELLFADGRTVRIPTALLLTSPTGPAAPRAEVDSAEPALPLTIPLAEDRLKIGRRTVPVTRVLLHKTVQQFETTLDEPLAVHNYDVERVPVNRPVETAPDVRQEGATTIYPLLEERLVVTRQLVLKEEIRITRRESERRDTQTVTLRREQLEIERQPL